MTKITQSEVEHGFRSLFDMQERIREYIEDLHREIQQMRRERNEWRRKYKATQPDKAKSTLFEETANSIRKYYGQGSA